MSLFLLFTSRRHTIILRYKLRFQLVRIRDEIALDFLHSIVIFGLVFNKYRVGYSLVATACKYAEQSKLLVKSKRQKPLVRPRHSYNYIGVLKILPSLAPLKSRLMRQHVLSVKALVCQYFFRL